MKEIIVAVDFSEASINSVEHALTIAKKTKADIHMIWVNKASGSSSVVLKKSEEAIADAKEVFDGMVEKYQKELPKSKIDYAIRNGKVYKEIAAEADERKSDLIIIGTHGTSGFDPFWLGSNANKMVSMSPCPIITIRLGINVDRPLTRIVIPIDSTLESRQKVAFTSKLAKYFDAEVHLLGLYTSGVKVIQRRVNEYVEQVGKYFDESGIKYVVESIRTDNITRDTIAYAEKIDANLIAIMTEQEKSTANILLGPYAQQMVNHSPIPVLSVQPKEFLRTFSK